MKKAMYILKLLLAGIALFVVSFLLLNSVGCGDSNSMGPADEKHVEDLERTLDGAGAARLDARTNNGSIAVRGTDGNEVVVQIRKQVRAPSMREAEEFALQVQVRVRREGDEIRIYGEYPEPPAEVEVVLDYDIRCPARLAFELATLNGGIEVRETEGRVEGETTNGSVFVRASGGPFLLKTTNGGIEADLDGHEQEGTFTTINGPIRVEVRSGNGPLTATTTNASIRVELPADFSGQLDAATVNGRIRSEFHPSTTGGAQQTQFKGSLGEGGDTVVKARTTNGNIDVEKS